MPECCSSFFETIKLTSSRDSAPGVEELGSKLAWQTPRLSRTCYAEGTPVAADAAPE